MDKWDALLERSAYCQTIRVTAWVLRFISDCKVERNNLKKISDPLVTKGISTAINCLVKLVQKADKPCLQTPGWKLMNDEHT